MALAKYIGIGILAVFGCIGLALLYGLGAVYFSLFGMGFFNLPEKPYLLLFIGLYAAISLGTAFGIALYFDQRKR